MRCETVGRSADRRSTLCVDCELATNMVRVCALSSDHCGIDEAVNVVQISMRAIGSLSLPLRRDSCACGRKRMFRVWLRTVRVCSASVLTLTIIAVATLAHTRQFHVLFLRGAVQFCVILITGFVVVFVRLERFGFA